MIVSTRWKKTAISSAALSLLLGLCATSVHALSLGRLTVLSSLGEPLRAEIDVLDINAEEASSLRTSVANPNTYVSAGLDYNPAMSSLVASLQRRPDGRAYLRLSSSVNIGEPFVDLILETSWASGRIVRNYTMLFDPPSSARNTPTAPTLAQTAPAQSVEPAPTPVPAPVAQATSSSTSAPSTQAAPAVQSVKAKPAAASPSSVTVKAGDTASKIATRVKSSDVSLDQMLVALMRSNPSAFVNDNVNRLRSGAVLEVPTTDQAKSTSAPQATQIILAQSKDFGEFRRNLASTAPEISSQSGRKATGTVEAKVEDKKPASSSTDKLTLSKGAAKASADEAKIAKERAAQDAAKRAAELNKNIEDLKKLNPTPAKPAAAAQPSAPAPTPVPAASAPAAPQPSAPSAATAPVASAPASVPVTAAPAVVAALPASSVAAAPTASASAAAPSASAAASASAPAEGSGLLDSLISSITEDPTLPVAGGGILALLGGFGFYRWWQRRRRAAQIDSSFLESRLQPDSFFGASGGQRVDTNSAHPQGAASSMVYSASQLDAADDVDPVAEADVYLAYGRDLQAEEILKEAIRVNPGRLAIHSKLLEIFAKRRDTANFEATASQALKLTSSSSPEWTKICEMGQQIDPNNPLYHADAAPTGTASTTEDAPPTGSSSFSSTLPYTATASMPSQAGPVTSSGDLDLDLDFSLDDIGTGFSAPAPLSATPENTHVQTAKLHTSVEPEHEHTSASMPLDFDVSGPAEFSAGSSEPSVPISVGGVSLTEPMNSHEAMQYSATSTATLEHSMAADHDGPGKDHMLNFDMNSLSLDLNHHDDKLSDAPDSISEDPLETKLALAKEFVSIGDEDGARALIEEVIAESTGELRANAQAALAKLR